MLKRPLAVFGCAFFLSMLAAARVPAVVLLPLAVLLAAAFVCLLLLRRTLQWPAARMPGIVYLPLVCAAASFALFYFAVYNALFVQPVHSLIGGRVEITAHVTGVQPTDGDLATATIRVTSLDGGRILPFTAQMGYVQNLAVGDDIACSVRFRESAGSYSRGSLRATPGEITITGQNRDFLDAVRLLQYSLGDAVREHLPARLGGVAAAMTVGDKRYLPYEAKDAYRTAGLSHLLVVSGLHMSVICGSVFWLLRRVLRKRTAAAASMAVVVFFMLLTGLSGSVVRCGTVFLVLLASYFPRRRADIYTSLGLAAVLLCLQNPYAASDIGVQLTFSATLGVLLAGHVEKRLQSKWEQKPAGRLRGAGRVLVRLLLPTTFATLGMMPSLVLGGLGVSLLSIPANILGVPLLLPVMLAGWVLALFSGMPVLLLLTKPAALVCGALLAFLEWLTEWAAMLPGTYLPVGGWYLLLVLLVLYGLVAMAAWRHAARPYLISAALVLVVSVALGIVLQRGIITIQVAGNGTTPSVVAVQNGQAVVLYRSRNDVYAIQNTLWQLGSPEVALLVDMRLTPSGTEYETLLAPQQVLVVNDVLLAQDEAPAGDLAVYLRKQGEGSLVCLDAGGCTLALYTGAPNLAAYGGFDMLLAGTKQPTGAEYSTLLAAGALPMWVEDEAVILAQNGTQLRIRPHRSMQLLEVEYGTANG